MTLAIILGFYIFVLSCVAGYQLISKVPGTLHAPLMSRANAISGVTILGAITVASNPEFGTFGVILGVIGIILATIDVVGGFLVTDRMLKMFRKK